MRVAIVGAGAVGCYLAARLGDAGHHVTLVGRGEQVEAITRHGLLLRGPRHGERLYRLPCVDALNERCDLILLTVKTQDVPRACLEIRASLSDTPVVAMQNGVRADVLAADILGPRRVAGAVVMCAATYVRPGEVSVEFPGWLIVGEPFGGLRRRSRALAALLNSALPAYLTPHLQRVRYSKLISNLNNALCAATGLTLPQVMATPAGHVLPLRVMREGRAVVRAAGIQLDHGFYGLTPRALRQDPSAGLIALLQGSMTGLLTALPESAAQGVLSLAAHSRLNNVPIRGSTWQSIARGRPSEIDYLNGEIVRLGQRLDRPTPLNSRLVDLVHQVERSGDFCRVEDLMPGEVSVRAPLATVRTRR